MEKSNRDIWWKSGVVYQIYPRSFCDSNGDGIGDLKGITSKISHIKNLGATIVWLSPIFSSPNDDNGYDISDYRNIMQEFGKMEDFKEMLKAFHDAGIKVVLDLVANHTSDEHEWFIESRKSKDNPYRDYYFWREGKYGNQPPNNWTSFFTGSAWELDPLTGEYYMHLFSKKQPDLNWDNPKVRQEIKDVVKFWLDMGVDGFRCDVINMISKREGLPNGSTGGAMVGYEHFGNGPHAHEYIKELYQDVLSKYDCFTVGEIGGERDEALRYIDPKRKELSMAICFDHMGADCKKGIKWFPKKLDLRQFKKAIADWQNIKGQLAIYLENHDQPRSVSRFGDDKQFYHESAKMLPITMYFLQGTPFIYQGQEIGMTNAYMSDFEDYKDVETINVMAEGKKRWIPKFEMMRRIKRSSRDNARTPMQWDDSENAGFTTGKAWLKINPNYTTINAKAQADDPNSIYSFYKTVLKERQKYDAVFDGKFKLLLPDHKKLFAYSRTTKKQKLVVVSNFSKAQTKINAQELGIEDMQAVFSNYDTHLEGILQPYEAIVYFKKLD